MLYRRYLPANVIAILIVMTFAEGLAFAQERFRLTPHTFFLIGMSSSYRWLSGDMLVPAGGRLGSGTMVDLSEDLGVNQGQSTSINFDAEILKRHLLNFDFLMFAPSGLKRPFRKFRFQNKTYLPGTLLETKLDLNWLRLSYGYKLWNLSPWWIIPRVGLHYISFSSTINGETEEAGTISNTRSLDSIFPVVGIETRYSSPYGIDFALEVEGIHLITAGFLSMARLRITREIYPDIVLMMSGSSRVVQSIESSQPLNNEWFFALTGWSTGISFAF